ncbi:MAG: thymidine phosphorylase [Lachnospiraceae bacterium]|nr:thymidine phosphorylase [Lachnospiraceae bacterium]
MNTYDLIMKKRNGGVLNKDEIAYIVDGFTKGSIPDYQMSALLMAIYFKGMNAEETTNLTMSMADSGDRLDLSAIKGRKVDKHSTGGVGDKTSLIVGPILASLGVPVAKMSGRGLGHTGGTIDKLEAIPGFSTSISEEAFINQVNTVGLSIVGQTANLAPADKKIYALRDVTATVDNISLIAASIMSKKLAAGADAIVLDVKVGTGAFMKDIEGARALAETMVSIGKLAGRDVTAVITDMNEPLGNNIGNMLEVAEAVDCLKGNGEARLMEVSKVLACHMLIKAGKADNEKESLEMVNRVIDDGSAFAKMKEFVSAQGGDATCLDDYSALCKTDYSYTVTGKDLFEATSFDSTIGYLKTCDNQEVGMASLELGGGRRTKEDVIDLAVGIILNKHLGDEISADDTVATLYANDEGKLKAATKRFINAYSVSDKKCDKNPIVYEVI